MNSSQTENKQDKIIEVKRPEPIADWLTSIIKKWKLFSLVGMIGAVIGFFYAYNQKPQYESRLTFSLDAEGGGGLSGAMGLAEQLGFNIGSNGQNMFSGDNIEQIMTSRRIIEKVLLETDTFDNKPYVLIEYFFEKSGYRKNLDSNPYLCGVHFLPGKEKSSFSYLQDSILSNVYQVFSKNYISIEKTDKLLDIYEVKVTSSDEKFTKVFTDRLVNETNSYYIEICSKKAKETLDILEQRADAMKGNLGNSIANKAQVQDANLNPAFAAAQTPILKQEFNVKAYGEAYAEMFKNLELARFQYLKKIPLMQIIDAADYPMKKIKARRFVTAIDFALAFVVSILFFFWIKRIVGLIKIALK